jgi:hypothetical protein
MLFSNDCSSYSNQIECTSKKTRDGKECYWYSSTCNNNPPAECATYLNSECSQGSPGGTNGECYYYNGACNNAQQTLCSDYTNQELNVIFTRRIVILPNHQIVVLIRKQSVFKEVLEEQTDSVTIIMVLVTMNYYQIALIPLQMIVLIVLGVIGIQLGVVLH